MAFDTTEQQPNKNKQFSQTIYYFNEDQKNGANECQEQKIQKFLKAVDIFEILRLIVTIGELDTNHACL